MTSLQKYLWPFEGMYHLDNYLRESDKLDSSSGFPKWEQWVDEDKLIVQFLVAGYPRESFTISAQQERLTIEAKKTDKQEKSKFAGRSFKQTLQDPHGQWDFASACVEHKDGILRLEVPIRAEAQTKLLTIK